MGFGVSEYHSSMAQSLKTKYLLLALGVGAGLSLLLGGFAYYQHRIDTADIDRLIYAAVQQGLEADSTSRANGLAKVAGALLAPALAAGNSAAMASIAGRLLEERDIERVEVTDAHGTVLFSGSNPRDAAAPDVAPQALGGALGPLTVDYGIPSGSADSALRGGGLQDLDEPHEHAGDAREHPRAAGAPENGSSQAAARHARRRHLAAARSGIDRGMVHCAAAVATDLGLGQVGGPHRRGGLHAAIGRRAAR